MTCPLRGIGCKPCQFVLTMHDSATSAKITPISDAQRDQQVAIIRHQTEQVPKLAEAQIKEANAMESQLITIVGDDDADTDSTDDAEAALKYVQQRRTAWEQFWANAIVAAKEVQSAALIDIAVGNVLLDVSSTNQVGVPKEVIDKVSRANIKVGDVTLKDGATNQIGVF